MDTSFHHLIEIYDILIAHYLTWYNDHFQLKYSLSISE